MWSGTAASVVDLHPAGFVWSRAYGVAEGFQVGAGSGPATGGQSHALLWNGTAASVVDLHPEGFVVSGASGISGDLQVGWGYPVGSDRHALMWSGAAASVVDLHPNGYTSSVASDVSGGLQVGWAAAGSFARGPYTRAHVWNGTAASAIDLHQYLPSYFTRSVASGVGEDGTIVGVAIYDTGQFFGIPEYDYAVMWTPVPEPSNVALLGMAVVALASRLRDRRSSPSCVPQFAVAFLSLVALADTARTDIYQWEYINPADPSHGKRGSATLAPDGAGVNASPGAYLAGRNLSMAYLIGADLIGADLSQVFIPILGGFGGAHVFPMDLTAADLSQADLRNANFTFATLTGANFRHANLANASFSFATVTDADFADAEVRGADLSASGFTAANLYSTSSYQAYDLSRVVLRERYLSGWNFAGQNLANASFYGARLSAAQFGGTRLINVDFGSATLNSAVFTAADARGARFSGDISAATTTNLIWPDGHINGLTMDAGELLVVHEYQSYLGNSTPFPITIDQHLTIGPGGGLRMVFEENAWDSTISFAPGIPVALGGTLELTFATDVNLASHVGRTFDLFDWTGVNPNGEFIVSSLYGWDLSNLYATGEVTLTAIPEPGSLVMTCFALTVLVPIWHLRIEFLRSRR